MRPAVTLLVLAALLVACGGDDDYAPGGQPGAQPTSPGAAKAPEKQPEKKRQTMTPIAAEVKGQYDLVKNERDPEIKRKAALEAAQRHAGVSGDALMYLGLLYYTAAEWEKAADAFIRFTAACPEDLNRKGGLYYASDSLSRAGRADEALTYVDELIAKHPDAASYIQAAAAKAGDSFFLEGKFDRAADALRKAVKVGSKYAGLSLVEALWVQGKFDEARTEAKSLLSSFEGGTEEKRYKALVARANAAGKPAPALSVEGWSDSGFEMSSLSGKVYMVYFWSMRKLAMAKKTEKNISILKSRYEGEGFTPLGLSKPDKIDLVEGKSNPEMSTEEELKMLETWVFNFKTTWPLGLCRGESNHEAYGFWATPSFGIVDKQGRLRFMHSGSDPDDYKILAKVIEVLLDE